MCEKCKNHEPNEETKAAMVRARNLPSARFDNFGDLMESIEEESRKIKENDNGTL